MKKGKRQRTSQFGPAQTTEESLSRFEDAIRDGLMKRRTGTGAGTAVATIRCPGGPASRTGMPSEHWGNLLFPLSIMPSSTTSPLIILDFRKDLPLQWEPVFVAASGTAVDLIDDRIVASRSAPTEAERKTQAILLHAMDELFEDGVESKLSRDLELLVRECGVTAIDALRSIDAVVVRPSVVAEALRTLGKIEDVATRDSRFAVLSHFLGHMSPVIRNGALIGLSVMEDPRAIPYLQAALARERNADLKRFIERTMVQLFL